LRSQAELVPAYYQLGQYQTARDYALSILPLARKYQDKISEGRILEGLGQVYQALGEYGKSIECFEQAAEIFREAQFPVGEAQVIHASGQAYASQRDFPKALELYRQSLSLARKLNNPLVEAQSLTGVARAERELGNLTAARTNIEAALKIAESVRSRVVSPALRASFLATRRNSYELYLALLMELHRQQPAAGHAADALQAAERARARSLLEILAEAPAELRVGVEPTLLSRERELRQKLSAKSAGQNRAASQSEEQAATFSREISALTAELEQVEAQIRVASPRYAALTQPQPLSGSEIQKEVVADADTLLLEYTLGEEQSFLFALTDKTFHSYGLPKREVIEKVARRYYELLTARSRPVKFEEPAQRAERLQQADRDIAAAGVELSRMILRPVAAELKNRRLLIVADGALQLIPFTALPAPGRGRARNPQSTAPLMVNHEVVHLPSASVLAVLRRELKDRKLAPKLLAVMADPVFDADDERLPKEARERIARERQAPDPAKENPLAAALATDELTRAVQSTGLDGERGSLARLPYARAEAQAILALAPQTQSFSAFDFAANQAAALDPALSQYRYVHFATHGLLNDTHPELSGLVLSLVDREGRTQDGFLRMVEVFNLNLPAELVVLSGCKTGLGKEIRGEGLIGLTRGFMHAGAARVLVSLWDVNDRATAELMARVYRGMLGKGLSPAAALRAAQLELSKQAQWRAPYYWASFVLMGEPR
jgi:CHAT domain-containing protein